MGRKPRTAHIFALSGGGETGTVPADRFDRQAERRQWVEGMRLVLRATWVAGVLSLTLAAPASGGWDWRVVSEAPLLVEASVAAGGRPPAALRVSFAGTGRCAPELTLELQARAPAVETPPRATLAVDGASILSAPIDGSPVPLTQATVTTLRRGRSIGITVPGVPEPIVASLAGSSLALGSAASACEALLAAGLVVDPGWIALEGEIDAGYAERAMRRIEAAGARGVVLTSHGGSLGEAMALGRYIRRAGLHTAVDGDCASACVAIFIAGRERRLGPDARVGVHRTTSAGDDFAGGQRLVAEVARYTAEMGVDPELALAAAETPSWRIRWLTRSEMEAWGVLVGQPPAVVARAPEPAVVPLAPPPPAAAEAETRSGWPMLLVFVGVMGMVGWLTRRGR